MEPAKVIRKVAGWVRDGKAGQQGLRAIVGKVGSVDGAMGRLALFAPP